MSEEMKMTAKLYADRDIMGLDEEGDYYSKHVDAMTGEGLHCKSDIAAELGYRDSLISKGSGLTEMFRADNDRLTEQNAELVDVLNNILSNYTELHMSIDHSNLAGGKINRQEHEEKCRQARATLAKHKESE